MKSFIFICLLFCSQSVIASPPQCLELTIPKQNNSEYAQFAHKINQYCNLNKGDVFSVPEENIIYFFLSSSNTQEVIFVAVGEDRMALQNYNGGLCSIDLSGEESKTFIMNSDLATVETNIDAYFCLMSIYILSENLDKLLREEAEAELESKRE